MNEEELRRHLAEKHGAATNSNQGLEAMHRKLHQWGRRPQDRHDHEAPQSSLPTQQFRW